MSGITLTEHLAAQAERAKNPPAPGSWTVRFVDATGNPRMNNYPDRVRALIRAEIWTRAVPGGMAIVFDGRGRQYSIWRREDDGTLSVETFG